MTTTGIVTGRSKQRLLHPGARRRRGCRPEHLRRHLRLHVRRAAGGRGRRQPGQGRPARSRSSSRRADPNSPPMTEIAGPAVTLLSTGNPLPAPVTLTAADTTPTGWTRAARALRRDARPRGLADRRSRRRRARSTSPTPPRPRTASSTASSPGVARPFREPGVQVPDALPAGSPCCVPRFDANPERLRVDSDGLHRARALEVTTGAIVTNMTGPLDYALPRPTRSSPTRRARRQLGQHRRDPRRRARPATSSPWRRSTSSASSTRRTIRRRSDAVLTPTAFANRLNKVSLAIRNVMRIAGHRRRRGDGEPHHAAGASRRRSTPTRSRRASPTRSTQAYLDEGNDIGGHRRRLPRQDRRVTVVDVTQVGKDETYIDPNTEQADDPERPAAARPARDASSHPPAPTFPVTVIVNHLRSLSGVDDPVDGNRVRAKRARAGGVPGEPDPGAPGGGSQRAHRLVGDYNAYQFNDGYVDVIGTIKGTPTPCDEVVLAQPGPRRPRPHRSARSSAPADDRYSYSFDGNAQELDHVLVTATCCRASTASTTRATTPTSRSPSATIRTAPSASPTTTCRWPTSGCRFSRPSPRAMCGSA